jgi:hypothetical protein
LEVSLKPSKSTVHMACAQLEWLQLRFLGLS